MVYYFSGKETCLKKKELKTVLETVESPDINVAEFYEYTPEIVDFVNLAPFIGNKKICILYFFPQEEDIIQAIEEMPEEVQLYIIVKNMPDRRKQTTKRVLKIAVTKEFGKISDPLLFKCIVSRLKKFGYTEEEIEREKDQLMRAFRPYQEDSDMDLDTVQKHVEMIALSGKLCKENIEAFAPESAKLKGYKLSTMILDQDEKCLAFARKILNQGESAIGIMSLILYQIRVCYKAVLFSDQKYLALIGIRNFQLYENFLKYSASTYRNVYRILLDGINRIKKGEKQDAALLDCIAASMEVLKGEKS